MTDLTNNYPEYIQHQQDIRQRVVVGDVSQQFRYVAGAGVAYDDMQNRMVGALVVIDIQTMKTVDQYAHEMDITFPYVPGLFSFREVPALVATYHQLTIKPELIICDGHGIAHPQGVGMASHLGVELDVSTIGCAKKRLVGTHAEVPARRGGFADLLLDGEVVGSVLRTQHDIKPLFVSVGHNVSLAAARKMVLHFCQKYRQPETTRRADALVREKMKEIQA